MSGRVLNWAMKQVMPSNHALVLRQLAWRFNDREKCAWPSQRRMAADSNGVSLATVKRCLKDFERLGIVQREWRMTRRRRVLSYTIDTTKDVYWKRSTNKCSWREYVKQQEAASADQSKLPGETSAQFVARQLARRKAVPK